MIEKEYLSVAEISKQQKTSTRQVRNIVGELAKEMKEELIYKDSHHRWMIHRLLLPKFQPKRKIKQKYYALSVDTCSSYSSGDIDKIMEFVIGRMENPNIEINYVVEQKNKDGKNHLHCYINCNQRTKLIENLRLGFSNLSYYQTEIYDLDGWKDYITKDGGTIKTLVN